jgi:hypothetical protein
MQGRRLAGIFAQNEPEVLEGELFHVVADHHGPLVGPGA